ncbi:SDR family NAD(P)-dependent oxidoreductase [Rhizobium sp. SSA_523]|uniref:SDR family NAD(P)-dependent oxidoreductase n=1 Tax=Rhizobium sp. SSA_523 TaxID=2952477 RepID=UPI002091647F|nr:SDR family NAD(P)-dependent oxidoreductase [Rhizobium sp. SSA_523]MCO5731402.1 SDR family oxidoreductase [Rhizobium sp. SSA_523]WKC22073.1 SDR family NAD(P)-dependent oxidoreductase [Rhizobium sp. SSA_523]
MAGRLQGKRAIVFGAGSSGPGFGNGKAAAIEYAREGAEVACVDLSLAAAQETRDLILAEGYKGVALDADVTRQDSVDRAVTETLRQLGTIDILHNNVGVTHMGGPVELSESEFQASVDLNIGSVYRTTKAILPIMEAKGSGAVVNISSLAAIRWTGYPYFAYYAMKAAVNQATVAIAMQYARRGIRANCILPGMIDTPLIYKQISSQYASQDDMVAARNALVPLGKMGDAFDIARASVFLASDEAKFITGICLPVDGGQSCAVGAFS